MAEKFLSQDRVSELWAATIAKIGASLAGYVKTTDLSAAISSALTGYATTTAVNSAIQSALTKYMTTEDVEEAIATAVAEVTGISIQVASELPGTGKENIIYMVPSASASGQNIKDEYMWINGAWEIIGDTNIDLSGYWQKTELVAMTSEELSAILV